MAKKAKKAKTSRGLELKIVNPNAAGIDVAATEMQVCVPEDRDGDNNRSFGCFTEDYQYISEWLKACRIETVAMESTGVYWLQLFFKLQADGFDVILVNPRDARNISGKKTDEADAEWLMLLHSYGLLKASFQPENDARSIRNLSRHRNTMMRTAAREIQHMQKALEQMNLKLCNVFSDVMGDSGQAIIKAILNGERNPKELVRLVNYRCKTPREIIEKSLEGTWDDDHMLELRQSYDLYEFIQKQITECEQAIEKILTKYQAKVNTDMAKYVPSMKVVCKKNSICFDVEAFAYSLWGVNPMNIPGMSLGSLLTLMGELGHGFEKKFESSKHFCSWCNLVPNTKISGGKELSSKLPKRHSIAGQAFRMCANALKQSKSPMGYYFRRKKAQSGHLQAIISTAHKIATIFFQMVVTQKEYNEKIACADEQAILQRKILRTQKQLERLNEQARMTA